mmetsp:Transcript_33878/g.54969  ORF Transcript_33878/g.54969 Transcript_33878/m.54969 type:complete len:557 (+) Transcript_33878:275-1945(+)
MSTKHFDSIKLPKHAGFCRMIEKARSNRSICGSCDEVIEKGHMRVGIKRCSKFHGKMKANFVAIRWHHEECDPKNHYPLESSEPPTKKISESMKVPMEFRRAARQATLDDIFAFRDEVLDGFRSLNEAPKCPLTGLCIPTKADGHVHHAGRFDFKKIVDDFVKDKAIYNFSQFSYVADQFTNVVLEREFVQYHRTKCRLIYVHKTANLWLLKRNPNLDLCNLCHKPHALHWIHGDGVCHGCIFSQKGREKFLSQQAAWFQLGLCPHDLKDEIFCRVPNPKNPGFHPAKIFLRTNLERVASTKFGSVKKAQARLNAKAERVKEIRKRRYDTSRSFQMKLRNGRTAIHSKESGEYEYATLKQLRYLRNLGETEVVGLSKKKASEIITAKVKTRFIKRKSKTPCFKDKSLEDCALHYFFQKYRPVIRSNHPNIFEPGIDILTKKKWDLATKESKEQFFKVAKKERRRQRRKRKRKSLEALRPKKSRNSYIFFFEHKISHFRRCYSHRAHTEIVKLVGQAWKSLSEKERQPYIEKANMDQIRYENEMAVFNGKEGSTTLQ